MEGRLPPVVGPEECVAGLSAKAAEETGLKAGTPVFGGFFDVVSAAVCAGLADPNFVNVIMGTRTIVTSTTDRSPQAGRRQVALHLGSLPHARSLLRS